MGVPCGAKGNVHRIFSEKPFEDMFLAGFPAKSPECEIMIPGYNYDVFNVDGRVHFITPHNITICIYVYIYLYMYRIYIYIRINIYIYMGHKLTKRRG